VIAAALAALANVAPRVDLRDPRQAHLLAEVVDAIRRLRAAVEHRVER
jgi:hypothetical protein